MATSPRLAAWTAAAALFASAPTVEAQVVSFGSSCAGGSGTVPTVGVNGMPVAGQPILIEVKGPPNSAGVLIVGSSDTTWIGFPLPLDLGFVGFPGCFLNVSNDLNVNLFTDPAGCFSLVANSPMAGVTAYLQVFVIDFDAGTGALGGFSQGLSITGMAAAGGQSGELVITEFLPNPDHVNDNAGEFFEVFNTTGNAIDIEGWVLKDLGTESVTLDNGGAGIVVPPSSYFVLGRSTDPAVNGGIQVDYDYSANGNFNLSNSMDEIVLMDTPTTEVDRVEYGKGWLLDGGRSTALDVTMIDAVANDDPANWSLSTCTIVGPNPICNPDQATPGLANDQCLTMPCPPPPVGEKGDVIVTEFLKDPQGVGDSVGEWIELLNTTASDVDIEGWTLTDLGTNSHLIDVAGAGLMIPGGGRIVIGNNSDMGTNGGVVVAYQYSGFQLANSDDEIMLTDQSGNPQDEVKYDDGMDWPDSAGMSISLDPAAPQTAAANNDPANWCHSSSTIPSGDTGTPNAANDACPPPGP